MGLSSIVDKEKKLNRKPRSMNIDIEDIKPNKYNKYRIENIDELANEIKENGLYRPLEVYQSDEKYILLGGERRYHSLLKLYNEGHIDSEIPCLVYARPESITDERMQIITSNSQRDLDDKQKIEIVKELLEILEAEPQRKPKNMPTVEWLAPYLGCSPRTAQKYKNLAEGKAYKPKEKKASSNGANDKNSKSIKDLIKSLEKFNKTINDTYWKLNEDERNIILEENENGDIDLGRVLSKLTAISNHLINTLNRK